AHGEHRRTGEEQLAFLVAVDLAAEPVVAQPVQRLVVDHSRSGQLFQFRFPEAELLDRAQQPAAAAAHPVAAAAGPPAGEALEGALALRGPVAQGAGQHGQLVAVGEQCGASRWSGYRRHVAETTWSASPPGKRTRIALRRDDEMTERANI